MIKLIKINPKEEDHIKYLYDILKTKNYSISHKQLPIYEKHKIFIEKNPYRNWYLIKEENKYIGSIYLTYENVIGINIPSNEEDKYIAVIKLIIERHQPLKPIKSVRNKNFLINSNPNNKNLINALKYFKTFHIQNTYALEED